jgi:excinuclease ABC subunit A
MYILDEPTTGLHFADIQRLLEVLDRLVEAGNSVVVIEHNLDVIKVSDRLIDLGPEGGDEGGQVIAQGTPEEIVAEPGSHTGRFLADVLPVKAGRGRSTRARGGARAGTGNGSRPAKPTKPAKTAANGSKAAADGPKTAGPAGNGSGNGRKPPAKPRRRTTAASR